MRGAEVGDALAAAIDAFTAAGIDTPRLDAEVLLSGITGFDRAQLISDPTLEIPPAQARVFSSAVRRRQTREPVAYILGSKGFRYIELEVDSRVLIPRPETEMLVELALELKPSTVLEIGTGSGAIALAVADEIPEVHVLATDVSAASLALASRNARLLGSQDRVDFLKASLPVSGEFDLILANLPYVAESEQLEPEIMKFEPHGAVFGGPTGLEVFEEVLGELASSDIEARAIGLEIGMEQGHAVSEMVRKAGWSEVETRADLARLDRVVVGRIS